MEKSTDIPTASHDAGKVAILTPLRSEATTPAPTAAGGGGGKVSDSETTSPIRRQPRVSILLQPEEVATESPSSRPVSHGNSSLFPGISATSTLMFSDQARPITGGIRVDASRVSGTTSPPEQHKQQKDAPVVSSGKSPSKPASAPRRTLSGRTRQVLLSQTAGDDGSTATTTTPTSTAGNSRSRTFSMQSGEGGSTSTRRKLGGSKQAGTPSPRGRRSDTRQLRGASPAARGGKAEATVKKGLSPSLPSRRRTPEGRKRKGRKALQSTISAEEKARLAIDAQYEAEWKQLILNISIDSFEPQRRAILQLQEELRRVRQTYGARATRAEDATAKLVKGTLHLLKSVEVIGSAALEESRILDTEVAFVASTAAAEAVILPCARDPASNLSEVHVPAREKDPREPLEIRNIRAFFDTLCRPPESGVSESAMNERNVVEKADEVYDKTMSLTDAFTNLINRTHRKLQQSNEMIKALQLALDERATRVKVADDLLRETTAKHRVEVDSAIRLCGKFGMELRQRMDAVEKEVRDSLDELIQRSTEVCVDNNAFNDHAQLIHNKENTMQYYMSKMEKVAVEQGSLLRDVRLKLLQLWKERCGDGDEERATLKHSGLPKSYHAALEACDRDTILRLVHFVALSSEDARGLLISGLDEHKNFLDGHTAEAQAVAQRSAMEAAVTALLQKLHEEGEIKLNPRRCETDLADKINDMVLHYNQHMTTLEKKQRRAARKAVMEEAALPHVFFDSSTPVPDEYASAIASRTPLKMKRPALCEGIASRQATYTKSHLTPEHGNAAQPVDKAQASRSGTSTGEALPHIETCRILSHLRKSHPSALDPPGTATVVGFGRWGGEMAQRRADGGERCGSGPPGRCHVSARAAVREGEDQTSNPPPSVPPRISVMKHVLTNHCHDLETLIAEPQMQLKRFPGEDEPFLRLQRALSEAAS
ncbi:hypothetical protein DQ04_03331030 [Trypanosoma grayi]|uniref:hypothetical protein n=1 Tax=Trypanosoma grayi TaxID=71804 RepID=UPI0004F45F4E|nr:hypothetical protein DQ04_03331030 [Trypanosoma grayi]KEG10759.1 hypothetical protein DQ04_03331030 [Trypanosoma grayi]